MSHNTLSYETEPRGLMIGLGVVIACAAMLPTTVVAVQFLTGSDQKSLPTNPISVIPGLLLALWGGWLATHHVRVTVDRRARSVTWVSRAFGLPLRTVSWQGADIGQIRVAPNGGVKRSGYCALVSGPRGTRTLLSYFHSSLPPTSIRDSARALGIEIEQR